MRSPQNQSMAVSVKRGRQDENASWKDKDLLNSILLFYTSRGNCINGNFTHKESAGKASLIQLGFWSRKFERQIVFKILSILCMTVCKLWDMYNMSLAACPAWPFGLGTLCPKRGVLNFYFSCYICCHYLVSNTNIM